jgi:hypothetical protein
MEAPRRPAPSRAFAESLRAKRKTGFPINRARLAFSSRYGRPGEARFRTMPSAYTPATGNDETVCRIGPFGTARTGCLLSLRLQRAREPRPSLYVSHDGANSFAVPRSNTLNEMGTGKARFKGRAQIYFRENWCWHQFSRLVCSVAQADGDAGVWAVEGEVGFLRLVDAGVHCAEEEIRAIAYAEFCTCIAIG